MLPESNDYIGTIVDADLQEKDGKMSAFIVCRPSGDMLGTARWFGSFSETVIRKGPNEGKMVGEMTAEKLGEFGITDFSKIRNIIGQPVAFGVKHKESDKGDGKVYAEVSFLRPPGSRNPATPAGIASINRFRGVAIEAARKAPKPAAGPAKPQERDAGDDGYDDHLGEDPFA